jgi:ADP-ribose pyrophosphatase
MKPHGPWKILQTNWVHQDPWVKVQQDNVIRPDGQPGTFTVVHIKPGVCVLPMKDDGTVYLTEEFHYAVGKVTIECVSGGRDEGETLEQAARRELREEIGIEADEWLDLGRVDPFTACLLSPTQMYAARGLRFVAKEPEGTEVIRRVAMPFEEAVRLVMANEITHAPSMTLILKAARL